MAAQCKDGQCFFQVSSQRDSPGDPPYPVVVCPKCLTRWFGHKDTEGKILNPKIPDALRDAIFLDQLDHVEAILVEMGFSKRPVPNALISVSSYGFVPPEQSEAVIARPQRWPFKPIYFVSQSRGFSINDIRIGNHSQFIRPQDFLSETFLAPCDADFTAFRVTFGNYSSGELRVTMTPEDAERFVLPDACSAFAWETCQVAMDIVVTVTNMSDTARRFESFILGKVPHEDRPPTRPFGPFGMQQ